MIEIYNMMGERIYHSFLPHPDSYRDTKGALKQINLSGQPNGIYLYRVVTTDGKLVGDGKFVIEK